jgi:hypothetical protein
MRRCDVSTSTFTATDVRASSRTLPVTTDNHTHTRHFHPRFSRVLPSYRLLRGVNLKPAFRHYLSVHLDLGAWPLPMGPKGSTETSDSNHLTPRKHPEDGRIHFNRCGGLRSDVSAALRTNLPARMQQRAKLLLKQLARHKHPVQFWRVSDGSTFAPPKSKSTHFRPLVLPVRTVLWRKLYGITYLHDTGKRGKGRPRTGHHGPEN